ncbi:MAG: hypothetical protein ACYCST_10095 [Acidimicrobiales bacterium]
MGAGDAGIIARAAVRNYGRYRPIHPEGIGYFAVSVFAVTSEVTTDAILAAMPQGQYSTCRAECLLAEFTVLPTAIADPDMTAEVAALQSVHFDVLLTPPDLPAIRHVDPIDDAVLTTACTEFLAGDVMRLLVVFGPRYPNPFR